MLLKDFEKASNRRFSVITRTLKENFNVSIKKDTCLKDLDKISESVVQKIDNLKRKGKKSETCPDLSKFILMREAVQILQAKHEINESKQDQAYAQVVKWLCDFVVKATTVGDEFEDALRSAMKEYRSSHWRFDDMRVQNDVSNICTARLSDGNEYPDVNPQQGTQEMKLESRDITESFVKDLRKLLESEVEEAEIVIATKGFSKSLQEMIEKIGRLQNEDLPPLADQMRQNYGNAEAHGFHETTQLTLQHVLDALYESKEQIDNAVQEMARGNLNFAVDMDLDSQNDLGDMGSADDVDMDIDLDIDAGDEGDLDIDSSLDGEAGDLDDLDVELGDMGSADEDEALGRPRNESAKRKLAQKMKHLQEQLAKHKKVK